MKVLVTGCAGFIGMHTCLRLLARGDDVVGIDNLNDYYDVRLKEDRLAQLSSFDNFSFLKLDMTDHDGVGALFARQNFQRVIHLAAQPGVRYSLQNPLAYIQSNLVGFTNILEGCRHHKIEHLVFASSYGFNTIGLRYFNVFGPRQDPNGAYAAGIPKWIASMIKGEPVYINGDGETSRDFCFIENVCQINLLAAMSENPEAANQVYNVAVGDRTTLNQLYDLHLNLLPSYPYLQGVKPIYRDFRAGDVRHSLADINKAVSRLGYLPTHRVGEVLKAAMAWYTGYLQINEVTGSGAPMHQHNAVALQA